MFYFVIICFGTFTSIHFCKNATQRTLARDDHWVPEAGPNIGFNSCYEKFLPYLITAPLAGQNT